MRDIRVNTWNELWDAIFTDSWQPDIQRHRSPFVFRGMEHASDPLETSLIRLAGDNPGLEGHLLRNFRKYAEPSLVDQDTVWHWLSLAAHHGLPTRLLDFSVSPLVAAHFATRHTQHFDRDGVIWALDIRAVHRLTPPILWEQLSQEDAWYFTVEMLAKVASSLQEFDSLSDEPAVLFFEPPSIDARITNQFALFAIVSDPIVSLGEWLEQRPDLYHRIIIPAEFKWEVRDKLDQVNITERVLFPGLDGLSQWQKRYYMPHIRYPGDRPQPEK
jgi:hypothetical protein